MEPITTVSGALTLAKTAGELSKKLYDFGKGLKDRDAKQKIEEVLDSLNDLKQRASELEDENRDLREQLRFKSDDYEFRNPFWYEKTAPQTALCPKCFADRKTRADGRTRSKSSAQIGRGRTFVISPMPCLWP